MIKCNIYIIQNFFNHCLKTTTVCFILRIIRWLFIQIEYLNLISLSTARIRNDSLFYYNNLKFIMANIKPCKTIRVEALYIIYPIN